MKYILMICILFIGLVNSSFARIKEGGNSVINSQGGIVSAKINCLEETTVRNFVKKNSLIEYEKLKQTYQNLTFNKLLDQIKLCVVTSESEINQVLGISSQQDKKTERVAGWVGAIKKGEQGQVYISQSFLDDVDRSISGRNRTLFARVLLREVLHNELHSKSPHLDWVRRDQVVSHVLDKIIQKSLNKDQSISRDEFQRFNQFLESNGFPSGFEYESDRHLLRLGGYKNRMPSFIHYLSLAAGNIRQNRDFSALLVEFLFKECYLQRSFNQSCLEATNEIVHFLRYSGQKVFININKHDSYAMKSIAHAQRLLIDLYAIEYDIDKESRFGGYVEVDANNRLVYSSEGLNDIISAIDALSSATDVIRVDQELFILGLINNSSSAGLYEVLGVIPFVESGLYYLDQNTVCEFRGREYKINAYDIVRRNKLVPFLPNHKYQSEKVMALFEQKVSQTEMTHHNGYGDIFSKLSFTALSDVLTKSNCRVTK